MPLADSQDNRRDILDTLLTRSGRIYLKQHHIARTFEALQFLGKTFALSKLEKIYDRIEHEYPEHCLRLIFNPEQPELVQVETKKLESMPDIIRLAPVFLTPEMTLSAPEPQLQYKWAQRQDWDTLLQKKPDLADDILLLNQDGSLRECSRFNVFVWSVFDEAFFTPPLSSGCLNGVFRRASLQAGIIEIPKQDSKPSQPFPLYENEIYIKDLSQYEVWVANSVRGILRANLI